LRLLLWLPFCSESGRTMRVNLSVRKAKVSLMPHEQFKSEFDDEGQAV